MSIDARNQIQSGPIVQIRNKTGAQKQADTPAEQSVAAPAAANSISESSRVAERTFEQLDAHSDVDMALVQEVRQAIASGEFELDEAALTSAILDMHR